MASISPVEDKPRLSGSRYTHLLHTFETMVNKESKNFFKGAKTLRTDRSRGVWANGAVLAPGPEGSNLDQELFSIPTEALYSPLREDDPLKRP
jgi:hypothetical protein